MFFILPLIRVHVGSLVAKVNKVRKNVSGISVWIAFLLMHGVHIALMIMIILKYKCSSQMTVECLFFKSYILIVEILNICAPYNMGYVSNILTIYKPLEIRLKLYNESL